MIEEAVAQTRLWGIAESEVRFRDIENVTFAGLVKSLIFSKLA